MARQLLPVTPLARRILESGKAAYVVAGEVGINYNRLLDYADGRMEMSSAHRVKLARYFGTDGWGSGEDGSESSFDHTEFDAVVRDARVTPGGDAVLVLLAEAVRGEALNTWRLDAWPLVDAAGQPLAVRATTLGGHVTEFSATVESLRVRPGVGLEVRLRVPAADRDAVLVVGYMEMLQRFEFERSEPSANTG